MKFVDEQTEQTARMLSRSAVLRRILLRARSRARGEHDELLVRMVDLAEAEDDEVFNVLMLLGKLDMAQMFGLDPTTMTPVDN